VLSKAVETVAEITCGGGRRRVRRNRCGVHIAAVWHARRVSRRRQVRRQIANVPIEISCAVANRDIQEPERANEDVVGF
jgi:hypothetical protein